MRKFIVAQGAMEIDTIFHKNEQIIDWDLDLLTSVECRSFDFVD